MKPKPTSVLKDTESTEKTKVIHMEVAVRTQNSGISVCETLALKPVTADYYQRRLTVLESSCLHQGIPLDYMVSFTGVTGMVEYFDKMMMNEEKPVNEGAKMLAALAHCHPLNGALLVQFPQDACM